MNQGFVAPENKKDSQKMFGNNRPTAKILPKADNLKQFKQPIDTTTKDKKVK